MKKIACLAITVFFAIGAVAAFAGQSSRCAAKCDEKSLFQIVSDTMAGKYKIDEKDKLKPVKEIKIFQNISDGIKQGAAEAKGESLRTK